MRFKTLLSVACALSLLAGCPPEVVELDGGVDAPALDAGTEDAAGDAAVESRDSFSLDAPVDDAPSCACDDGVACTADVCSDEGCRHSLRHQLCPEGRQCTLTGCELGPACVSPTDCVTSDPCLTPRCDQVARRCAYALLDADGDGEPSSACGGADCDDSTPSTRPGAFEQCDGIDSNCSGGPEPSDAYGCAAGEACGVDGRCACPPDFVRCGEFCRDPMTSVMACGGCDGFCADFRMTCVAGSCTCPPGLTNCDGSCVDLRADEGSCGRCGNTCVGTCSAGMCTCAAGETLCELATEPRNVCANLAVASFACGACNISCWNQAECEAGTCTFRLAGTPQHRFTVTRSLINTVGSPDGHVFELQDYLTAPYFEFDEAGVAIGGPLLTAPGGIVEHDETGAFVRSWASEAAFVQAIAATRTTLWVIGQHTTRVSFAGQMFTPLGAGSTWVVIGINRATGAIVTSRSFLASAFPTVMAADATGITLAGAAGPTLDMGAGLVSSTGAGLVRLDAAGNVRAQWSLPIVPSRVFLSVSPTDDVVVVASGGVRHYAPTGTLLHSFVLSIYADAILATSDGVITMTSGGGTVTSVDRWVYGGSTATRARHRSYLSYPGSLAAIGGEVIAMLSNEIARLNPTTLIPRASVGVQGAVWPVSARRGLVRRQIGDIHYFEAVDLGPL